MARDEDGQRRRDDFLSSLRLDWSALEFILCEGACSPDRRQAARGSIRCKENFKRGMKCGSENFVSQPTVQDLPAAESFDVSSRRRLCSGCKRQRCFWCCECCCPIGSEEAVALVPRVSLPLRLHVLRHPKEKASKSSAIPLKILAPNHVRLYEARLDAESGASRVVEIPQRWKPDSAPLASQSCDISSSFESTELPSARRPLREEVCCTKKPRRSLEVKEEANGEVREEEVGGAEPSVTGDGASSFQIEWGETDIPPWKTGKDSVCVLMAPGADALPARCVNWSRVTDVVLLDCTWFQVGCMKNLPLIQGLQKVSIEGYESVFWRQHSKKESCFLSTAECVYFLLREFDVAARAEKRQLRQLSLQSANCDLRVSELSAPEFKALFSEYEGQYDPILFYFALTDKAIYGAKNGRRWNRPLKARVSSRETASGPAESSSFLQKDEQNSL